jgi:hypothetical protein
VLVGDCVLQPHVVDLLLDDPTGRGQDREHARRLVGMDVDARPAAAPGDDQAVAERLQPPTERLAVPTERLAVDRLVRDERLGAVAEPQTPALVKVECFPQ